MIFSILDLLYLGDLIMLNQSFSHIILISNELNELLTKITTSLEINKIVWFSSYLKTISTISIR